MNNVARKFGMLLVIGAMAIGVAACETMSDEDAMMASDAAEAAAERAARSAAAAQAAAEAAAASAERAERMFQQSMEK